MARGAVRLVTWNVWWRLGPWRERLPAIERVLLDEAPDVLVLQEAWRAAGPDDEADLAARLGRRLGMRVAWSPFGRHYRWRRRAGADGVGVDVGVAVLSRWPHGHVEQVELPDGPGEPEGRTALGVLVDHPLGPLPVVTAHLTSHPSASAARVRQVDVLAGLAGRLAEQAATAGRCFPPVVAGDFNAEPASDEMRRLGGLLTAPAVDGLVLVDAWRYRSDDDPGWTWRRENPYLAEGNPDARVDQVLVGLPSHPGLGAVREVGLVGAGPVDGTWPSDHAGVRVDLSADDD